MKSYKVIALDMDGTVLNEEKTISPTNRRWIQKARDKGVTVMFATGRGVQHVIPYMKEMEMDSPIVTVNGSEVWKSPNELLHRDLLDADDVRKMREIAVQFDSWYWAYSVDGVFNRDEWVEDENRQQWLKFGYYIEDSSALAQIIQRVQAIRAFELTNSHPCNIEINPKGTSKASGLLKACEMLGVSISEVIAMGDSMNDLKMIEAAGLGVSMGNAQDAVKKAADQVTVTNEEHGVAHIIQQIFFPGESLESA